MPRRLSLIATALAACSRAPIATCADDLRGVWHAPGGMAWLLLDNGVTLEGYPMAPDVPVGSDGFVAAPRALELSRTERGLTGSIVRRYMRGADSCDNHSAVHVTACRDDVLELVSAETMQPIAVAPCRWPVAPSRVERWTRD